MKIDGFVDTEKKYDLYNIEVNGVKPWPYFRVGFWNYEICSQILSNNIQSIGKREHYRKQIKSLFFLLKRRNKRKLCKAEILFFAHERRVQTGKKYECIYTNGLVEKYRDSVVLERPYRDTHLTPTTNDNVFYIDFLQWKATMHYRLHYHIKTSKYKKIYSEIQEHFSKPIEELRNIYKFTISCDNICRKLTRAVIEVSMIKRELGQALTVVQPKIIVDVVYYSRECMILNELAKERGIPTIELQHGTMHSAHAAYQFPDGCGEIKQFPDYVFVFSEYWKKCAHLPIPDDHIKVTGYPYFERQLNYYKSTCNQEDRVNIIFVSQGTIGKELSKLAADLCDLIDGNSYHIIYKLHPGEYAAWRERVPWLVKNNIEVVDSLEHNIYEYFAKSSIQVGVYSTAIYEGLGFGLKTYIYNIGHADTMAALCEQGYASYVSNAQELFENIYGTNPNTVQDGKEFWKMNSFENICHEIDQLLACRRKEDRS